MISHRRKYTSLATDLFNRILGRHPHVEGELGFFGLGAWWLATFSQTEREYIEGTYQPGGLSPGSRPLTQGIEGSTFETAAGLLTAVAGRLRKRPEDRELAARILAKAEGRGLAEEDILGLHFAYQQMARLHYAWRERFVDALDSAFAACYKQTRIAPQAAKAFRDMDPTKFLPMHVGYELMTTILAKQGDYAQAIEVCRLAQSQGWAGNWAWRIQQMTKQLSYSVRSMSAAGLTPIRL